jgi:PKD domain
VKRLLCCCGILAAALLAAQPAHADPVIGVTPGPFKTGATITFNASPGNPSDVWDLDGDGVPDKTGSPVTWAYPQPGPVTVTVSGPDGTATAAIQLIGPSASFASFPAAPVPGEPVQFVYSSHEATDSMEWDLNGDGVFDDAKGPLATKTFPLPGTYAVSLRVTGIEEPPPARSTTTQLIRVAPPLGPVRAGAVQARLISPFPVVRITGKVMRNGAQIKSLTIRAPYGATVKVRCSGRGCPFRRTTRTLALAGKSKTHSKTVRIKKLEHHLLRRGASIKVFVSRRGEYGKYTRFLIRRGKPPRRTDLCLAPGTSQPTECPSQ